MIERISQKIHDITRKKQGAFFKFFRKILGKILCSSPVGWLIGIIFRNRIKNGNCTIDTSCDTVLASTKARLFWGVYETAEIDFAKKYLNPDYDVIELGSSIGVLASHVSKIIKHNRKILCIEANQTLLGCLKKNLEFNSGNNNFEIVNAAIYYGEKKFVEFSVSPNSLDSHVGSNSKSKKIISVPAITLSEIIKKYSVEYYTLICDIEGAEKAIFDYDADALKYCKQLHIEMQENEIVGSEVIRINDVINLLATKYNFKVRDNFLGAYVLDKE